MIGERLSKLRKEKNMSQDKLGKMLSLSKFSISLYENEKNEPTENNLIELSRIFNVSTDFLLGVSDIPNRYDANDLIIRLPANTPKDIEELLQSISILLYDKYVE